MDEMMLSPLSQPSADSSPARGEPDIPPTENTQKNLPPEAGGKNEDTNLGAPLAGELAFAQQMTEGDIPESRPHHLKFLFPFLPPVLLTALFYALQDNKALMTAWVKNILAPFIQTVGKFWSIFPFSVAELLAALFLAGSAVWLIRTIVLLIGEKRGSAFLRRVLAYICLLCWLWCAFCWMWNCTYRAAGFAEEYGLSKAPYSPEQLVDVTVLFAVQAAGLADHVPRNEDLSFAVTPQEAFDRAEGVYAAIGEHFPGLNLSHRRAKPIFFSRLQSALGYTGVYFPFTGEANVNVDQTPCLVPFTIAHEMAHQRMVASEDECNFIGVLACISSDDVVFQYSGWMMGLVYLINAVYDISPDLANEIMRQGFSDELRKDWNDNYDYWQALKSPTQKKAQEAMDEVYDGYLKSQGQTLGLMSYDACVDLLVNYFS